MIPTSSLLEIRLDIMSRYGGTGNGYVKIFGVDEEIPTNPVGFLFSKLREVRVALSNGNTTDKSMRLKRKEILVRWLLCRLASWPLLNMDGDWGSKGIFRTPRSLFGGGIFQDNHGRFMRSFSYSYGVCTFTRLVILALQQGLIIVKELGIKKLIVNVKNKNVVSLWELH
ncbi:hypothetical protein Tco_0860974 [Tanacetum coccineum]|uniref:RNase H type-1 domain-containing protein n=1 Tax=Tanacetum coccineum TaxID=301880 RepID=A0ABQ5BJK0_9ASTR